MLLRFGVRKIESSEIVAEFDNPIVAKQFIEENQSEEDTFEIVERYAENIVEAFPDGKSYITGVQYVWKPYKL